MRLYSPEYTQQLFNVRMNAAIQPRFGMFVAAIVSRKLGPLVTKLYDGGFGVARAIGDENQAACQSAHIQAEDRQLGLKLTLKEPDPQVEDDELRIIPAADTGYRVRLMCGRSARKALQDVMIAANIHLKTEHEQLVWTIVDQMYQEGFLFIHTDVVNQAVLTSYFDDENEAEIGVRLRPAQPQKESNASVQA